MNINVIGLVLNLLAGMTAGVSVAWSAGVHTGSGLFTASMVGAIPAISGFLTNKTKTGDAIAVGSVPSSLEETLLAIADEIKRSQIVRKQQEQESAKAAEVARQASIERAAALRAELARLEGGGME